jgi:tyrosyl-tRNA synthetase
MTLLEDLQWRGLVADCTDLDALGRRLAGGPVTLYCGFDPTADSLQLGNLVPLLALRRFQLAGHRPVIVAGGATGMIGDPSGKSSERNLQAPDQVDRNIAAQAAQLARFLDFAAPANPARLVNNADWTAGVSYLEFLREVGKYFTVNWMVAKESVRARMEDRDGGISYTEFSYMLLQAFDFYHLRRTLDCELQIGATDQWGNITAGTELIRKKLDASAFGLVFPLLTKADGTKYGKTADGAVWLDPKKTSPYRFYQFFVNADDAEVVKLLKVLTFLPREEIEKLEAGLNSNPGAREAQKALARELTALVHGVDALAAAIKASNALFAKVPITELTPEIRAQIVPEIPPPKNNILSPVGDINKSLTEIVVASGLCPPSNAQARTLIAGGGIYVNDQRITDPNFIITQENLLDNAYLFLRRGSASNVVFIRPSLGALPPSWACLEKTDTNSGGFDVV